MITKSIAILCILTTILSGCGVVLTTNSLVRQAQIDAARDAKADISMGRWFRYGAAGGVLYPIGCSIFHCPPIPAARLIGKSPEYVNAYTIAYITEVRRR